MATKVRIEYFSLRGMMWLWGGLPVAEGSARGKMSKKKETHDNKGSSF